jgi:hypothetical protein
MLRASLILLLVLVACRGKTEKVQAPPPQRSPPMTKEESGDAVSAELVTSFWKWFTAHASELRPNEDLEAVMLQVNEEMEKIGGVYAEIGRDGNDRVLVLTADGARDLFPVVQQLYAARPSVPGWKIVAFRQRSKPGQHFPLEIDGKEVSATDSKFVAEVRGAKIAIDVFLPGFDNTYAMKKLGWLLLDHTVGEYDMETKVDAIEFSSIDKAPPGAKPLTELPAAIDALH